MMSMESKVTLLKAIEAEMRMKLPAEYMEQALWIMSSALNGYEVESVEPHKVESDDLLDTFLSAKSVEGCAVSTTKRYRYIIEKMMRQVGVPTSEITVYHIRQYLASEKQRGLSDRSLAGIREVFSSYFGWLHKEGLLQRNPCANLGTIKYKKKVLKPYTDTEIEQLKRSCTCLRDLAIVTFLYATGCRISEMTALNRDMPDLVSGEVKVLGKGNKERTVFLSDIACMYLRQYLESRTDDNEALFINRSGKRLQQGGVRIMLNTLAKRAHVVHCHPHKFRRTLATNLIEHGMQIQEVAKILGHDKLDTTMRYVSLTKANIKYAYQKFAS